MAKSFLSYSSDTLAGIVAAVNAGLAPLITGAARVIVGFDLVFNDLDRRGGVQLSVYITLDTAGAAALANPYVMTLFDEASLTDLNTTVAAYLVANTNFVTGVRNITEALNPSRLPRFTGWAVASADAANGPTNWAPK